MYHLAMIGFSLPAGIQRLKCFFAHCLQVVPRANEPIHYRQRGVCLRAEEEPAPTQLSLLGSIAAGRPIEAVEVPEHIDVPAHLRTEGSCFVLRVKGDSMMRARQGYFPARSKL